MATSGELMVGDTGTLGKAMALLDVIAGSDAPLRFTDLLAITDQPRGTLHRQLVHLMREGLIETDGEGRYSPGLRLLTLAARSWARNDLRQIAEPHLARLRDQTGETVHLGVLHDLQVVYLDKVEGRQSVRMYSHIGNAAPAYCTGVGKAALSTLGNADLKGRVGRIRFHPFTAHTHGSSSALLEDIEKTRLRGYALDEEEHEEGIRCVAAAIILANGSPPAGLSVTGPAYRITLAKLIEWAPLVRAAANAIILEAGSRLAPRV